jgi:hypothetical protein
MSVNYAIPGPCGFILSDLAGWPVGLGQYFMSTGRGAGEEKQVAVLGCDQQT